MNQSNSDIDDRRNDRRYNPNLTSSEGETSKFTESAASYSNYNDG